MELEEFIELVKIDRVELAEIITKDRKFLDFEKTLECLNYLSYPLLMLLDKECLEHSDKLKEITESMVNEVKKNE